MKVRAASLSILPVLIMAAAAQTAPDPIRTLMSLDRDWRFLKSDASGAEQPGFEDANWRTLDVPHDWSIEGPFDSKNPAGGAGAFLPAGVGWYRKHFTLPAGSSYTPNCLPSRTKASSFPSPLHTGAVSEPASLVRRVSALLEKS